MAEASGAVLVKPRGRICSSSQASPNQQYVRGCGIRIADLRFNSQGNVLDSEEMAANRAVNVNLPPAVAADGSTTVDVAVRSPRTNLSASIWSVAADGAAGHGILVVGSLVCLLDFFGSHLFFLSGSVSLLQMEVRAFW
jgi:hypothetical protein